MIRQRHAKIVATLGPASNTFNVIHELFSAGADVFRLNFSHGTHEDHKAVYDYIRQVEHKVGRPIGVLADLQGPKLRIGTFADGPVTLSAGQKFRFDMDSAPGTSERVCLPHPEIFQALKPGAILLLDDGRLRVKVLECGVDYALVEAETTHTISNRKGVNVPGVALPISPLTAKDRTDLEFALSIGADWIALSFVQRPEDILEAKHLINGRAKIMAKIEKPMALEHLEAIINLSDGVMVARGDLGVEMLPEEVPGIQKRIVRLCRALGRPVVVATQMLDSMIAAATPTRAEASDVANAIFDGADAVALSAESASGQYPIESVSMMDRIIRKIENDAIYPSLIAAGHTPPPATVGDATTACARHISQLLSLAAIATLTSSGATATRTSRERPDAPILALTATALVARQLAIVWGVHAVQTAEAHNFDEMVSQASRLVVEQGLAQVGQDIAIIAGVPFKIAGSTNLLHIARIASR